MSKLIRICKIIANTVTGLASLYAFLQVTHEPEIWLPLGVLAFLCLVAPHTVSDGDEGKKNGQTKN